MAGPSLHKHEKDLNTLQSQMENLQKVTTQASEENSLQMANLAKQMSELSAQFNSFTTRVQTESDQAKIERNTLSHQIQQLFELAKVQAGQNQPPVHNSDSNNDNNSILTSIAIISTTSPTTLFGKNAFKGRHDNSTPQSHMIRSKHNESMAINHDIQNSGVKNN